MQTKSRDFLAFLFGEHFRKLAMFKKLYAAAGLLLLAGVLLLAVASVVQDKNLAKNQQNKAALQSENPSKETAENSNLPTVNEQAVKAVSLNETPKRPVKGAVITAFGWQEHPVYKDWRYHPGIDIGVGKEEDIQAVFSGKVIDIYIDKHYGLTAVVESKEYKIFYGSLSTIDAVKGGYIKAGQFIGKTGECRDEPKEHLHLAVKKGDNYIDPVSLF